MTKSKLSRYRHLILVFGPPATMYGVPGVVSGVVSGVVRGIVNGDLPSLHEKLKIADSTSCPFVSSSVRPYCTAMHSNATAWFCIHRSTAHRSAVV